MIPRPPKQITGSILTWFKEGVGWTEYNFPIYPGNLRTASKEERKDGLWQVLMSNGILALFTSCPWCGRILDTSLADRKVYSHDPSGLCVVCPGCTIHFFPYYVGYTLTLHRILLKELYRHPGTVHRLDRAMRRAAAERGENQEKLWRKQVAAAKEQLRRRAEKVGGEA